MAIKILPKLSTYMKRICFSALRKLMTSSKTADYLQMNRETAVVHILEKYDIENIESAVLQMMTYMYADAASELQDLGSSILAR